MGDHKWNSQHSKEDQTMKISKSIFVTNFPEGCTTRDLWKVCNDYGTVVDVFIPFKKSKAGKRFAFVRFIKEHDSFKLALVLDDSCIKEHDFSLSLMGKVKDVSAIPNLCIYFQMRVFKPLSLLTLKGKWVLLEFVEN
ncbi:RNA-directed DNA polymerase, eukaryota [Tanacetum coccineum]